MLQYGVNTMFGTAWMFLFVTVYVANCSAQSCDMNVYQSAADCIGQAASVVQETMASLTTASLNQACETVSDAVTCVTDAIGDCSAYSSLLTAAQNIDLTVCSTDNSNCPPNTTHKAMYCYAAVTTCQQQHPLPTMSDPNDAGYCQSALSLIQCSRTAMDPGCAVVPNVSLVEDSWNNLEFACQQVTCSAVQHCQGTFQATAGNTEDALDHTICMAYSSYATCLDSALPGCHDYIQPVGQPNPDVIATYVTEGCTLMTEAAIYSCAEFSSCFSTFINDVSAFSPHELCNVIQETLWCAISNAMTCGVSDHQDFVVRVNNFLLHIANHGCGVPRLELGYCGAFADCTTALADTMGDDDTFIDTCHGVTTFQQCGYDMLDSCSLRDDVLPSLHQLSLLTDRACTALGHMDVDNCTEFISCVDQATLPSLDGHALSTYKWCTVTLKVLQCAKTYSSQCNMTSSARVTLLDVYTDAVSQGCTNVYSLPVTLTHNGAVVYRGCSWLLRYLHVLLVFNLWRK